MAVAEEEKTRSGSGGAGSAALKAAAAAAATGAATYAVKKVRSHDGGGSSGDDGEEERGSSRKGGDGRGQSILASAAQTSWEAAADALLPVAEDAAEAAGRYLAQHGPELLRDRIVPKFIEAFNEAR